MKFSNDNATYSTAEAYATSKSWTLSTTNGTRTVYVKYKDVAGNWSGAISDTIILDNVAPSGTISINNGASSTTSQTVTLTLSATDATSGANQMQFSNDNATWSTPQAYTTAKSWTLSSGYGTKTVYVKFSDKAGNWSTAKYDTIAYSAPADTTPPTGTISINSAATYTNTTAVTLALSATDSGSGMG